MRTAALGGGLGPRSLAMAAPTSGSNVKGMMEAGGGDIVIGMKDGRVAMVVEKEN